MRVRVLVSVSVLALVAVPAASAKIWFMNMGGSSVAAGDMVSTEIAGCAIIKPKCPVAGTIVFVASGARESSAVATRRRVGKVDRLGRLRFRMPDLAAGTYHLAARVNGRGAWLPASAGFTVTG